MWILKLWPGLDYLVRHGTFRAWLATMFYALFAMSVLCTTFLWDAILPSGPRTILLFLFVVVWGMGVTVSQRFEKAFLQEQAKRKKDSIVEDTLPLAQTVFLRRNFYEAERLLRLRLEKFPEDVPARFFLVSVLKFQQRYDDAHEQLTVLEVNPRIGLWGLDLYREKEALKHHEE